MQDIGQTHPLMPGIRCDEINRPDWPRTLHDKQLSGFSPLALGMDTAPRVWRSIEVLGEYSWAKTVQTVAGPGFLVEDGRLSFYDAVTGAQRWRAEAAGVLVFWGRLGSFWVVLGRRRRRRPVCI